jgi:hypothetical protein
MPEKTDKFKKIKDERIKKFAIQIEAEMEAATDNETRQELIEKFVKVLDEKLQGRQAHIHKLLDKDPKLAVNPNLAKKKYHQDFKDTQEAINVLKKIKRVLQEQLKNLVIPKTNHKEKQRQKQYEAMLTHVKTHSTVPKWYTAKVNLRLLDSEVLSLDLNIKDRQAQIKLREACEKFNQQVQSQIEKSVYNALIMKCVRGTNEPGIAEFTHAMVTEFPIDRTANDLKQEIWDKVREVIPFGSFIGPYFTNDENPYKKNIYVEQMVEYLCADLQKVQASFRVKSLVAVINGIDEVEAVKILTKNALNNDAKGIYKTMATVLPQVIEQLKQEMSTKTNPDEITTLQAKIAAIEVVRENVLNPPIKSKKSLLISGGTQSPSNKFNNLQDPSPDPKPALAAKQIPPKASLPKVDKSSALYQFFDQDLRKEGGIGQQYARENARYNGSFWSIFRAKDVINEPRIRQLNELQTTLNLIQSRDNSFSSEVEQKRAAEALYWKLFEIRDEANSNDPKLHSIPLEKICQKLMDEIIKKGLKPNRHYQDALENNPLLKEIYAKKPHGSFSNFPPSHSAQKIEKLK